MLIQIRLTDSLQSETDRNEFSFLPALPNPPGGNCPRVSALICFIAITVGRGMQRSMRRSG
jgi:hypothetical protein